MMEKMKKTLFFIFMMGCFLCAFRTGEAQAESVGTPLYTAEDLLKMSGSSSSFYLANDIDMTEYGLWTPIDFSGTLDGNGYAISNLKVTGWSGGLFGLLDNASVKNLKLMDVEKKGGIGYRDSAYVAGALADSANDSALFGIAVSGTMNIFAGKYYFSNMGVCIGGIIGDMTGTSTLESSFNNMDIQCSYNGKIDDYYSTSLGGLVGWAGEKTKISNCYNTGNLYSIAEQAFDTNGYTYTCGLVGKVNGKLYYSYNIGNVVAEAEYASYKERCKTANIAGFNSSGYGLNCYALDSSCDADFWWFSGAGIKPQCYTKTETELKTRDTYAGWDFDDVWMIDPEQNDGYPILITEQAGEPTANYDSGTYQGEITVSLESSTEDAVIYYTLDGSAPTTDSYIYYNPITISKTTTLRAFAIAEGYKSSSTVTYRYAYQVKTPKASLKSGKYQGKISVKLSCNTDGAAIYYTTNGQTPTQYSTRYTGKIKIKKTTTLKVIAIKGEEKSKVLVRKYVIKK